MPTDPVGMSAKDCPSSFSSPLQSGIYAYISFTPLYLTAYILVRAGKANSSLGQIELGGGVRVLAGILAPVKQGSLLVIRSEPNSSDVVGRAGPLLVVNIPGGPSCTGGATWFKVNIAALNLSSWATENNLYPCLKGDRCN